MKTLKELLLAERSYRSFDRSVRISRDTLAEWVDHTRFCPSSVNLQMLKFVPAYTEEVCGKIFPLTRWAGKIKDRRLPPEGHEPVAYLLICADDAVVPNASGFAKDVGIAAQTLMLSAVEDGYGGCMIGSFDPVKLREVLSLGDNLTPMLLLAFGKPDETVVLTDVLNGQVDYYRDGDTHIVPKRALSEVFLDGKHESFGNS